MLADTDGSGFTDSFWFTAPTPIERGIRQIVAVSIVDNSALANLNVATRFQPGDPTGALEPFATAGETPADLALCGERQFVDTYSIPGNWNTGFFDCFQNWEQWKDYPPNSFPSGSGGLYGDPGTNNYWEIQWNGHPPDNPNDPNRWLDFLSEIGVRLLDGTAHPTFPDWLMTTPDRRRYWLYAASRPFSASLGLTPFTLADELELRMYHGQNYPWVLSRLERAVNTNFSDYAFLRSGLAYEESSEYLDRLNNPELLHDNRRKVTVYNGARNDELPPWLRWRWREDLDPSFIDFPDVVDYELDNNPFEDSDGNGVNDIADRFLIQARRKLDLREMSPDVIDFFGGLPLGMRYLHQRLPWVLLHIFADGDERGNLFDHTEAASYLGPYTGASADVTELRELAAAFAANILAYRDQDSYAPLFDNVLTPTLEVGAIPLPEWGETEPEDLTTRYLGMERQPFLLEAFIGHVYNTYEIPDGYTNSGKRIVLAEGGTSDVWPFTPLAPLFDKTAVIVQIANPYDEPLILASDDPSFPYDYQLEVLGQTEVSLSVIATALAPHQDLDPDWAGEEYYLPPARDNFPTTMIVYSIPYPPDSGPFGDNVRNFFDLLSVDHPGVADDYTIIADMRYDTGYAVPHWSDDRVDYDGLDDTEIDDTIRLVRVDLRTDPDSYVVIDRLDGPDEPGEPLEFLEGVVELGDNKPLEWSDLGVIPQQFQVPEVAFPLPPGHPTGVESRHYMQWRSAVRAWGRDANGNGISEPDEVNPRYISARKKVRSPEAPPDPGGNPLFDPRGPGKYYRQGNLFNMDENPEDDVNFPGGPGSPYWPWFTVVINGQPGGAPDYSREPTFFDMNPPRVNGDPNEIPINWLYPDKGYYNSAYSLQMLQKDGDFQQIGELMNVWLYGHKLEFQETAVPDVWVYVQTEETFSERVLREQTNYVYGDNDRLVNRLREGEMVGTSTTDIGNPLQYPFDPQHAVPPMPAGLRVLDAFVCDGPGVNYNPNPPYNHIADYFYFNNALGFEGRLTPGLININTAPVEVLRILPQWYKLIHNNPNLPNNLSRFPRSTLPEAVISYRERFRNDPLNGQFAYLAGPDYSDRDDLEEDLRGDRGISSIGELRLLTRQAIADTGVGPYGDEFTLFQNAWTIDFAADNPFQLQLQEADFKYGAYLSTDVVGYNTDINDFVGDRVASDIEEANLLLAGASNLITTRSDVFTVYFRIRSFRQNPNTGVWNATDPEYIVDDSRYVMLVDRSEVNHPTDKAKILYLEKLPN